MVVKRRSEDFIARTRAQSRLISDRTLVEEIHTQDWRMSQPISDQEMHTARGWKLVSREKVWMDVGVFASNLLCRHYGHSWDFKSAFRVLLWKEWDPKCLTSLTSFA